MISKVDAPVRIRVGKLPIDVVDFAGALDMIDRLVRGGEGGTVYTPNVDHIVMAERNERFQKAYGAASLSLVDGTPVLWASRLLRTPLPMKVSGSDLVVPLMERAAERGYRVYFLGGAPGVADLARQKLEAALPGIQIVGIDDSRIDVSGELLDTDEIVERIQNAGPDLVLVALGAPKQEIWSQARRALLKPAVLIGVGASLDFVAGIQKRAPRWMSKVGVEWVYRLAQEPRRLAGRYLLRDPEFCWILLRQLLTSQGPVS
ncbi:MAG TPA: WecB/TagA/CpsF family glycosyltransferase [Polyangiaceae bacterium]|nr:WecB/TagA/CpsF family glycosyltransferase [Polyangiaceae bacterium]